MYMRQRGEEKLVQRLFVFFAFETVGAVKDILIVSHSNKHAPEVLLNTIK